MDNDQKCRRPESIPLERASVSLEAGSTCNRTLHDLRSSVRTQTSCVYFELQPKIRPLTQMENQEYLIVRQSFARCTLKNDFLVTFYSILMGASDEIKTMFAHTDMPRQRSLLKEALIYLISFPTGNVFSQQRVTELAMSHSQIGLNVRPELYVTWVDSLIESVRRHDPQFTNELGAAWRQVLAPGIAAMVARYDG